MKTASLVTAALLAVGTEAGPYSNKVRADCFDEKLRFSFSLVASFHVCPQVWDTRCAWRQVNAPSASFSRL